MAEREVGAGHPTGLNLNWGLTPVDMRTERLMGTQRMTVARAIVQHLVAQRTELGDGSEAQLFPGVFGIFGHGNVTSLGHALEEVNDGLPTWRGQNEQGMALAATAYNKAVRRRQIMAATSSIGPGATNMVTAAEQHVDLIADCIEHLREQGKSCIEPSQQAEDEWGAQVSRYANATLYPTCNSWYMGANIPGKPRQLLHHSGVQSYLRYCAECKSNDYAGFDVA